MVRIVEGREREDGGEKGNLRRFEHDGELNNAMCFEELGTGKNTHALFKRPFTDQKCRTQHSHHCSPSVHHYRYLKFK